MWSASTWCSRPSRLGSPCFPDGADAFRVHRCGRHLLMLLLAAFCSACEIRLAACARALCGCPLPGGKKQPTTTHTALAPTPTPPERNCGPTAVFNKASPPRPHPSPSLDLSYTSSSLNQLRSLQPPPLTFAFSNSPLRKSSLTPVIRLFHFCVFFYLSWCRV